MMKTKNSMRIATLPLLFLLLFHSLAGCTSIPTEVSTNSPDSNLSAKDMQAETENEAVFPGSYTVPDGWVKAEKFSSSEKFFYVEDGHENDETPDNISIEVGTNRYSEEEHEDFRNAIVRQLTMQLQGVSADVTGDGTHTDQDYIVYIFTISEEDVVTKQYYIIGDQRYCLIHLTSPDRKAQLRQHRLWWIVLCGIYFHSPFI